MRIMLLQTAIITGYCCLALTMQTAHSMEKFFDETRHNIGALAGALSPTLGVIIEGEQSAIINNPYKDTIAYAQYNPGISKGEHEYRNKRRPIVKAALEKMLNYSLNDNQIPTIAIICSGGGYRAALCTAGSLCGAEEIDLFDATTYVVGLSGSVWAIASLYATGIPIKNFPDYIKDCVAKPFSETSHKEKILIEHAIAVKKTFSQPRTLVDPYGDLLANRLLAHVGDLRQTIALSDHIDRVADGRYPYPIYTAIDGRESVTENQTWYEFTPHAINDRTNNIEIPSWAYGRTFEKGESTNYAPPKPLSHIMGTCGSAFAINLKGILEKIDNDKEHENLLEKEAKRIEGERPLPFWGKVPNYLYKMDGITDTTLTNKKNMKFVDAGLEYNLPYIPVSGLCPERTADILIFLDASKGKNVGNQLRKTAEYAKNHNLPFPSIDSDELGKKTISVFNNKNSKTTPIVIYMPRISDKALWEENKLRPEFKDYNLSGFDLDHETNYGFATTKKFQYTPEHSALVMNQAQFNMRANKEIIIKAIKLAIDRK